jgi:hypothetical protein
VSSAWGGAVGSRDLADEAVDRALEVTIPPAGGQWAHQCDRQASERLHVADLCATVWQRVKLHRRHDRMALLAPAQAARWPGSSTASVTCSVVVPTGKPSLISWSKVAPSVSRAELVQVTERCRGDQSGQRSRSAHTFHRSPAFR